MANLAIVLCALVLALQRPANTSPISPGVLRVATMLLGRLIDGNTHQSNVFERSLYYRALTIFDSW